MASLFNRVGGRKLAAQQLYDRQLCSHFKTVAAMSTTNAKPSDKLTPEEVEWNNAKPFHEMPGPKAVPLIGTTWTFFPRIGHGMEPSQRIDILRYNTEKYGVIWKEHFPGGITMVSTMSVQDSEKIFRTEPKFPDRPALDALIKYRDDNKDKYNSPGIVANGESWWGVRSLAQQTLLKPKTVNKYIPSIGQVANEFVDRIRLIRPENNEMNDDFLNELYRWALESVAVSALNTRLGCLDPNLTADSEAMKMIVATATAFRTLNYLTFSLPLWKLYKTPTLRELHEALDFLYDVTKKHIDQATENLNNRPKDSTGEFNSLLEEMIMKGMSYKDTATLVMDTMLGGIDTTAHWVAYHLYLLARNPDKQEKLRDEIFRVVGPAGSSVTADTLNKMPYLKACAKETLRVMPVTVSNARYASKDMVLSGYRVPKGAMLQMCQILTAVSEEHYERPKEYIPERWIKGHPMEGCPHAYSNLPFGFGKRMCLGRRLADLETWHITIKILQNFKIEYHHEDMDCIATLISKPNKPLRYKFIDL